MPIKVKDGQTARDMLAKYREKHGETIGDFGGNPVEVERIPTGVFPFDLATGGGFPRGRVSIVYGKESSNKTNLVLLAIRNDQRLRPDKLQVFIAIEPFDQAWARKLGVDTDRVLVMSPGTAEEAADMAENYLLAHDVSMVSVDSLAAMVPLAEVEKGATQNTMGGSSNPIGKMVRLTTHSMRTNEREGRDTALIYVNQTRQKIGVVYGDPETMPGGGAPRFQAALWVRVYGTDVFDKKITEDYPVLKQTRFMIKKNKVPILYTSGQFDLVTFPHKGMRVGDTDDFETVKEYLQHYGAWAAKDKGKGYSILGVDYMTQVAFKDRLYGDRLFGSQVREQIINKKLADKESQLIIQEEPTIDADGVIDEPEVPPPSPSINKPPPAAPKKVISLKKPAKT